MSDERPITGGDLMEMAEKLTACLEEFVAQEVRHELGLSSRLVATQQKLEKAARERDECRARAHGNAVVLAVAREMVSRPPRGDFPTRLHNIAYWIDQYDSVVGLEGATETQDALRDWARRLTAALGEEDS